MTATPSPPSAPEGDIARSRRLAMAYAGGLTVAALASWLRVLCTGSLRIDTGAPSFFACSLLLGVGLAVACVCALRLVNAAEALPRERLVRWALLANLPVALAVPLTSSDLFHYLVTGRLIVLGKNPFSTPLGQVGATPLLELASPRWLQDVTSYGPLTNLVLGACAWVGERLASPLWGSAVAFKLTMVACQLGFVLLAARHLRLHRTSVHGARPLVIAAFCPLLAWEVSGQAHNDGILVLALMLFVTAAVEERRLLAVVAIAAGTCAKVTLAPVLALYLFFLLRTRGARASLYALAAAGVGGVLMLPFLRDFHGFGPMLAAIKGASRSHSLGDFLYNVLAPLGPDVQAQAVRASFVLCLGVCAVAFVHAHRARTPAALLRGALVFLLAWDLTIPAFQPWYVTWLFPFAVAEADPRWQRLVLLYGIWTVLQWAAPIDPFTTMAVNGYVVWKLVGLLREGKPEVLGPVAAEPSAAPQDTGSAG